MSASRKKRVCIVGAGPAGLVAAKTLVQKGDFLVTVYEAADRVGGMWRAKPGEHGDKCSPEMRTNLSKFTVAFPELSWSSVDLADPKTGHTPASPPMFPKAWQVGRYLETYKEKFNLSSNIILNRRVVTASLGNNRLTWQISTEDAVTKLQTQEIFDYLVVASGFFDKPSRSLSPSPEKHLSNIQHSSQFRDVSTLVDKAGKIAVIGGSISGSEAAAQAAFQISSAKYSAGEKPVYADSQIYHIVNRPFYALTRYIPQNPCNPDTQDVNFAPKFLPGDLVLYNLLRRSAEGQISASISTVPPEKAQKGHEFVQSLLGGNQSNLGYPDLAYRPEDLQYPQYIGLTDTYAEFVRSGIIVPVNGWVDKVKQQNGSRNFDLTYKQYEPWHHSWSREETGTGHIKDVVGVIQATGYTTGLDYLSQDVKALLYHDPLCPRIPFLLTRGSILSEIPTIGFVGFYEGPYWGVMDMQARFICKTWADNVAAWGTLPNRQLYQHSVTEQMRNALQSASSLHVPQFWMNDYVGLIEELARETGVTRNDAMFGNERIGPIFPSRYQGTCTDTEADIVVSEVVNTIAASNNDARFVAAAVFSAMQGIWTLSRTISSYHASAPGGTFTGTAYFNPRTPTSLAYAAEYLYIESGTFTMTTGLAFPATRRYVYRYNEETDKISAWFAAEDGETVGTLFNTWKFYAPEGDDRGWLAEGHHWCQPDDYRNSCEFRFRGITLTSFGITYRVKGPNKDYEHVSWYKRPVLRSHDAGETNFGKAA